MTAHHVAPQRPAPTAQVTARATATGRQRHAHLPTWRRDAIDAVVWCGCLYAVTLWTSNGGIQHLTDTAGVAATSVGRLAGVLAGVLIMAYLALVARLPWVEQALGERGLTIRVRLVAVWAASLLLAHVVFVSAGHGASTAARTVAAGAHLVATSWVLALAVPGLIAVVALAVVAASRIRSAIRYQTWRSVHVVTALAAGLSIPHQVMIGSDFVGAPVHQGAWLLAWVGVYGSLVWFRVLLPRQTSARLGLQVAEVQTAGPGLHRVFITGRLGRLAIYAGQHGVWRFASPDQHRNVWSHQGAVVAPLAAAPSARVWEIVVPENVVTPVVGDRVLVEGPYGAVHSQIRHWRHKTVVVVAAGMGTDAARAVAQAVSGQAQAVHVVVRVCSATDPKVHDLRAHCAAHGVQLVVIPGLFRDDDTSWLPDAPVECTPDDASALAAVAPLTPASEVLVFGPPRWAGAVVRAALHNGIDSSRVHSEIFHEVISQERETL